MLGELVAQSWSNLLRNRTRSLLTMLGIVWGIVAVALLMWAVFGVVVSMWLMKALSAGGTPPEPRSGVDEKTSTRDTEHTV